MKNENETEGKSIKITIDVTKIVKYVAFAAIAIIGIIFGTTCAIKTTKMNENELL